MKLTLTILGLIVALNAPAFASVCGTDTQTAPGGNFCFYTHDALSAQGAIGAAQPTDGAFAPGDVVDPDAPAK